MLRHSRRLRGSPPPPEDSTEGLLAPPHTSHSAQIPVVKWSPQKPSEIWEALFCCFPAIRQVGMHAEQINNIFNGITLQQSAHMEFGNLNLAFVPQPDPHTYEVKLYSQCQTMVRMIIGSERKIVTFTKAPGAENLPLPCRALLDGHYRLAEILHASGMGEFIDQKIRDWEKMKNGPGCHQLRSDGGADLDKILQTAFWGRVTAG
ncbi:predicted protein [Aspergillus terreus NIH2624]|uniref:Uncharacterized protein n=1 Tax=Aspergillus terreus (strain NIH 2624 / FGSC A1156) TaxID=341663 RepID=Q0CF31_ASPTN|nr:uncharacterized protein ATEG_07703 [Aspergillus terreus NIH2624]EAU31965.1 predicted protein [Aspergillus terreus NIH2624]